MALEILSARVVPLGGLRAMSVRRTLPQRQRSLIGAWCFVDHYGPEDVRESAGMALPPHPHTGLSTVSWLFTGEIEHRDSAGHHAFVRSGELNLMTAGRGISHSEYSTDRTTVLHGAQLWLALPEASRETEPTFEHYAPQPVSGPGWQARVFIGSLLDDVSPVRTHSPLVGAELVLEPGTTLSVPVDPAHEHGLLVDQGPIRVDGEPLEAEELGYCAAGASTIELSTEGPARLLLLGGAPFGEQIVMWWNFVGRSHEEVVDFREHWHALLAEGSDERFGLPADDPSPPLPAPPLPNARMKLRG